MLGRVLGIHPYVKVRIYAPNICKYNTTSWARSFPCFITFKLRSRWGHEKLMWLAKMLLQLLGKTWDGIMTDLKINSHPSTRTVWSHRLWSLGLISQILYRFVLHFIGSNTNDKLTTSASLAAIMNIIIVTLFIIFVALHLMMEITPIIMDFLFGRSHFRLDMRLWYSKP